ncbi:MAG TPA: response regulator [Polyangiaceae bacterium]|nr:response regulator [Polyangiaceae bacterium]
MTSERKPGKGGSPPEEVELDIPTPSATPSEDAPVVVVVDDDAAIRTMLVKALGSTYTVYEARDGQEAFGILSLIPPPSAIVCDVMMPKLDGLGLMKLLRKDQVLRRVPVLLLTAKDSPMDVVSGINVGARHYVTKPFKLADVVTKVTAMTKGGKG